MRVLIVDDEMEICLLLQRMLSRMGHDTTSATSLGEGRTLLNDFRPELIFLDIFLPDGNGLSLIPEIKKALPTSQVIINSAYDGEPERRKAYHAGASYFMSKPFNRKMLETAMQSVGVH